MKKMAIFVEGQTEQIFIQKMVREILGEDNVSIILKRSVGGTKIPKQEIIRRHTVVRKPLYYVLINDCGSDNRVKSEILDNIDSLIESGYEYITGVRDLYPLSIDNYPRLEKGMNFLPFEFKAYQNLFKIIIIIQEVETWFLGETRHFRRVDKRLNGQLINKYLGFNPFAINAMERTHPAKDINDIYKLVGKSYTKRHWQIEKLVSRLDFDNIFRNLRYDIPSLNELILVIEKFKSK